MAHLTTESRDGRVRIEDREPASIPRCGRALTRTRADAARVHRTATLRPPSHAPRSTRTSHGRSGYPRISRRPVRATIRVRWRTGATREPPTSGPGLPRVAAPPPHRSDPALRRPDASPSTPPCAVPAASRMSLRFVLVVAVLALAAGVLYLGAGGLTTVAGSVGSTAHRLRRGRDRDPDAVPDDHPGHQGAEHQDAAGAVHQPVVGRPGRDRPGRRRRRHRLQAAGVPDLEGQKPAPIQETQLAPGARTIVPVALTSGINDFNVTIIGPGGESESSSVVRYVLDTTKPEPSSSRSRVTAGSINRKTVDHRRPVAGPLDAQRAQQDDRRFDRRDGRRRRAFLAPPPDRHGRQPDRRSTATDPAGNVRTTKLTVTRGSGKLRRRSGASTYSIKRSALPERDPARPHRGRPRRQAAQGRRASRSP